MPAHVEPDPAHDQQLATLLDELTEQFRRGQPPDLESVARRHPELAGELRQLWPAIVIAEEVARPPIDPHVTIDLHRDSPLTGGIRAPTLAASGGDSLPQQFGDYELLEELGRGGMGVVYKARQRSLDRIVAVKMILDRKLTSASDRLRFRGEAEAAARLEHPHIVPVYEVGEWEQQAYFTMKYVEGTTLARLVANGPLPPREAARLVAIVARAIHCAHQGGILHRDLKPSNILLASGGCEPPGETPAPGGSHTPLASNTPHVTDFGLAKRFESDLHLTETGAIVGTPSYMSPEQAAGSRGVVGPASDVYSLGAILYELLTGRPPFQAASALDTIMLVLEQDVVPPRLLNPRVDRELEMICLKCLQKPADLRYRTAEELARDLEAFLQGEPISVKSSDITLFMARMLRETHHAAVLENWGLLWMWHSAKVGLQCGLTTLMAWWGVDNHFPYLALWAVGLAVWGAIFWALRRRNGPVTFVERQIAHVWGAAVIASVSMFVLEVLLRLPVLTLSPVLAVIGGMVFLCKAGTLSGSFYLYAVALFLTAVPMALLGANGLTYLEPILFGAVLAAGFFFPGLKYYRQRQRSIRPPAPWGHVER